MHSSIIDTNHRSNNKNNTTNRNKHKTSETLKQINATRRGQQEPVASASCRRLESNLRPHDEVSVDELDFNIEDAVEGIEQHQQYREEHEPQILTPISLPDNQVPTSCQPTDQLSQDSPRTRRLFARFCFWRTKSDMLPTPTLSTSNDLTTSATSPESQVNHSDNGSAAAAVTGASLIASLSTSARSSTSSLIPSPASSSVYSNSWDSRQSLTRYHRRRPALVSSTMVASDNLGLAASAYPPGDVISQRRLWQSLVMPLVLGCIIFLVAVWTRQISLAFTNDTIIMIVILALVFIVMSGIAFWLSYDQQLDEVIQNSQQQEQQHQHQHHHCHHNHHHQCPIHNYQQQQTIEADERHGALSRQQSNESQQMPGSAHKCCSVSFIDCQPPDYHTAVKNSLPVSLRDSMRTPIDPSDHEIANGQYDFDRETGLNFNSDKCILDVGVLQIVAPDYYTPIASTSYMTDILPPSYDEFLAANGQQMELHKSAIDGHSSGQNKFR